MGRPPIGKIAMTGAERVRRHRERHGKPAPVTKPEPPVTKSDGAGITRTRDRHQAFGTDGKLQAQIAALKSDIFKLKAMLQEEPDAAKLRKKVVEQNAEIASMRRAMKEIAKERDRYRLHVRPDMRQATRLLTRANFNIIIKALHSDRRQQVKPNELAEAERLFITLKPLFIEAAPK
jgi:hypothetical protein